MAALRRQKTKVITGLARKQGTLDTVVTEQKDTSQASGLLVCPRIVSLQKSLGSTARIPVRVCNMSANVVKIQPKSVICSLNKVDVLDTWSPESSTHTHIPEVEKCTRSLDEVEALGVKVNRENLSLSELEQANSLLSKWSHIFSKSFKDLGRATTVEHEIRLTDDVPFKDPYRRIPPAMYEEVRQHLREMIEAGAIRKSNSPYSSNVVLCRKSDGSLRFCIDFRKLNNKTVKDAYNLPRVDDAIDSLLGARYFSKLDLRSGYWQVEVREEDKHKTAFSVGNLGFFECNRMPFGLTNAPATFQRLMEACMGELHLQHCLIFLDDTLVFSKTFSEHLERLEGVFDRLAKHNLKLKPSKCEFFTSSVRYLGHIVSDKGIETDPDKTSALETWPVPQNVKALRSLLGFTGYYRRFVKDYSKLVKPLNDLLIGHPTNKASKAKRKKVPWVWGYEQQVAFESIIAKLTSPPILAYADFKKPFIVNIDASGDGLGAVLYQVQDGKERVVAYASRGLRSSERNYPAHKLEFLCLKWALSDKFHDYLYGNCFEVRTDNNPLTYVLTSAKLDATGHRWLASLANYTFKLTYRAGRSNADADGLSRRPVTQMFPEVVKAITNSALVSRCELPLAESIVLSQKATLTPPSQPDMPNFQSPGKIHWVNEQRKDLTITKVIDLLQSGCKPKSDELAGESEDLTCYLKEWKRFEIRKGVLYRKGVVDGENVYQLVLPVHFREKAMEYIHDEVGHQGRDRTLWLARHRFYWPFMDNDIETKVKTCGRCIRRKTKATPSATLIPIETSRPLELVCIDFLQLDRSKGGYEDVLVITDHFTRFAMAIPTRNQTAATTAKALYEQFIVHYSFPERIHSDQGGNFESKVIRELCKLAGIQKSRTTPYHPMGNGMVERFNQTLIKIIGTLQDHQKSDWKSYIPALVQAYNSTKHESTGYAPHFLMFGWNPRLAVDVYLDLENQNEGSKRRENYVDKLKRRMKFAYKVAKSESEKKSRRNKDYYDVTM